jgi:hypothetical protein
LKEQDYGVAIAKRSISLSKTYIVVSIGLSVFAVSIGSIGRILSGLQTISTVPAGPGGSVIALQSVFPLISVPLMVFSALAFTTPVLLLYVYDKNNGVLEYFLSLGMDQSDVYRSYLKASLLLASILLVFEIMGNALISLIAGVEQALVLEIAVLTPVIALSAVSFVTIVMMAFSSLQKERVGSNQPLGIAIGVFLVLPTYAIPFAFPSLAVYGDLAVAAIIIVLAMSVFLLASRLIKIEKLLP